MKLDKAKKSKSLHRIALVIVAKNESFFIQSTVRLARSALRQGDGLMVIADSCTDGTAVLAQEAGAQVFAREGFTPEGKGAAISWFIQNYQDMLEDFSYLVILDADSRIDSSFIEKLEEQLDDDVVAAQCFLSPVDFEASPLSTIIALSEIIEQIVFDRIRSFMGWSVRLRGTGMVIKPLILLEVCQRIDTEVEDIAISLLLAEKRIFVKSFLSVVVHDPKPVEADAASRQRARWFRGQWAALWKYRSVIVKLVLRGPSGWSIISSLFFKPRWLELSLLMILGIALIRYPLVAGVLLGIVLLEGILILAGLFSITGKRKFLKSLLYLPGFIIMWIKGILLSLHRSPWLRARETLPTQDGEKRDIRSQIL